MTDRSGWMRLASLCLAIAAAPLAAVAADAAQTQAQQAQTQAQTQAQAAAAEASVAREREQAERQLAEAQRKLEESAREVAELSARLGSEANRRIQLRHMGGSRALLGVQVADSPDAKGATVSAVSPGGAAEEAGILAGDVITAIGGAELPAGPEASRALVDRMRELQPGLKVKVAVLRDGRKMEFDVAPRPAPPMFVGSTRAVAPLPGGQVQHFEFRGPPGDVRAPVTVLTPGGPGAAWFEDGTRFAGLEFATLSERLGSYFGVKSGVLVVRAGSADNPWKLQDGDVILTIDGRTPTSAAHASRILRSYQPGEKVKLRVQRDRKAQEIEVAATGGVRDFRLERRGPGGPGGAD